MHSIKVIVLRVTTVVCGVAFLLACQPFQSSQPTPVLPTKASSPTFTATVPASSNTQARPSTITPDFRPTAPLEPTITPLPTLVADERLILTIELLKTNGGCRLPCWWGFLPGVTKWSEVHDFIFFVGAKTSQKFASNNLVLHETGGFDLPERNISNRLSFFETENIIVSIKVSTEGRISPFEFKEIWANYQLEKIFLLYGKPSRAFIKTFSRGGESAQTIYSLWIFYDDEGVLIRYSGRVQQEEIYRICPSYSEHGNLVPVIEMYLQSPNSVGSLEELTNEDFVTGTSIQSIYNATGIDVEQFYNRLLDNPETTCLETPQNIWP